MGTAGRAALTPAMNSALGALMPLAMRHKVFLEQPMNAAFAASPR